MRAIKGNIEKINQKKADAAVEAGKSGEDILLVGVTKTRTAEEINEGIDAGLTDIGENKVQEIMDKFDFVKPVRWHMIGHLQTNKVKYIIDKVSMIHSVDSYKLAEEIDKRAKQHQLVMDVLLQVNAAEEESKFGVATEETEELLRRILENCSHVRVRGLMCIAPFAEDPNDVRVYFAQVRKLYEQFSEMDHKRLDFAYLSMGMSHDFEAAILEGSNLIRVGSAIFGERNYS